MQKYTVITLTLIFLMFTMLRYTNSLSASQVSNLCHCDVTPSYCDFNCCCDKDCSSTFTTECFNSKSSIFCLNSSYYFKIDSSLTPNSNNKGCYYYNQSTYLQEEVTISNKEVNAIASKSKGPIALASTQPGMDRGYQLGDRLTLSGTTQFNFFDSSGNCLNFGSTNSFNFYIQWRQNADYSCTGTSNSINLFNQILGRSVYSFSSSTSISTIIPQPNESSYNEVTVYFFIARYGSNKIQYIQSIKSVGKTNSDSLTRTLRLRFMDPQVDLQQEESSPSFFPQIPYDIFYPIYQIAYSYL